MSLQGRTIRTKTFHQTNLPFFSSPKRIEPKRLGELLQKTRDGDSKAAEEIICGHIQLVVTIVNRYIGTFGCEYLADDLDSAGVLGVVIAVNKIMEGYCSHDNVTGYIVRYIHGELAKCLRKDSPVPAPKGHKIQRSLSLLREEMYNDSQDMVILMDALADVCKTEEERQVVDLKIKNCTDREIAHKLEISKTSVQRIRDTLRKRYQEIENV